MTKVGALAWIDITKHHRASTSTLLLKPTAPLPQTSSAKSADRATEEHHALHALCWPMPILCANMCWGIQTAARLSGGNIALY